MRLTAAAATLPGRPAYTTLRRWGMCGVRGIRLETIVLGGITYTSREALQRFAERCTAARHAEAVRR